MSLPRRSVLDTAVAVAVCAAVVAGALPRATLATSEWIGLGLLLLGSASLALVGRAPAAVLAVAGATALAALSLGVDLPAVGVLVAVYGAFRESRRGTAVVAGLALLAAVPLVLVASGAPLDVALERSRDVLPLAWLVAAGAAGEALRQAERRADEAIRTREAVAHQRADEERLRIARELHDSLTHQISVIRVQADVAVHLARKRGGPVPEALLAISEAGRAATRDLRDTLETLREAPRAAPLGLRDVGSLVDGVRRTGIDVALEVDGEPARLADDVDLTGYRIVQESLTNVVRHAGATSVSVRVDYGSSAVVIQVDDDGTSMDAGPSAPSAGASGSHPPGVGHGLDGMRERVAALGGHVAAGSRPGGGFRVRAELPLTRRRTADAAGRRP